MLSQTLHRLLLEGSFAKRLNTDFDILIKKEGVYMQTIQFKVSDNYLNIVLTLLNNLKMDIVKELKVFKDNSEITKISKTDEQLKLDQVKGILKNKISDPVEYQRRLRDEWERE